MIRIVLDANVFVSAYLSSNSKPARILRLAAEEGKFQLCASQEVLDEVKDVLRRPRLRKSYQTSAKEINEYIKALAAAAIMTPGLVQINVVKADPADNKYLSCALESQADYIITGDHHLLDLKAFQGITIVTPADFLESCQ